MKIGDKIRHIRELKELKQEYVARQLNLSVTAYGNIERNETDITFRRLEEIARILDISSITILGFPDVMDFGSIDMQESAPGKAWQAQLEGYRLCIQQKDKEISWLRGQLEKLITPFHQGDDWTKIISSHHDQVIP